MGDIKQWYGVPAGHAKRLEKACSNMLPLLFQENPDQMQHMTLQISPSLLSGNFILLYIFHINLVYIYIYLYI